MEKVRNLDDLVELCHQIGVKVELEKESEWKDWNWVNWRKDVLVIVYTSFWPTRCSAVPLALKKLEERGYLKVIKAEPFDDAVVEIQN
jgi:hypothetical protein